MGWDDLGKPRSPEVQRGFDLIGDAIRRRRRVLMLSQRDVERLTGIDQSTISRIENGRRFGLKWPRFARLVAELGGIDFGPLRSPGVMGLGHQRVPFPHLPRPPGYINATIRRVEIEDAAAESLRERLERVGGPDPLPPMTDPSIPGAPIVGGAVHRMYSAAWRQPVEPRRPTNPQRPTNPRPQVDGRQPVEPRQPAHLRPAGRRYCRRRRRRRHP